MHNISQLFFLEQNIRKNKMLAKSVLFPKFNFCLAWNAVKFQQLTDCSYSVSLDCSRMIARFSCGVVSSILHFVFLFVSIFPYLKFFSFLYKMKITFFKENCLCWLYTVSAYYLTLTHKMKNLIPFLFPLNDNNTLDTNFSAWYAL